VTKLHAEGIGTVFGKLYVGTAENVPPSELIDTTGAGDAFIGSVLYGNLPNLLHIFSWCPSKDTCKFYTCHSCYILYLLIVTCQSSLKFSDSKRLIWK